MHRNIYRPLMLLTYAKIETALLRRFAHVIDDDEIVDLHDLLLIPHLLDPTDSITEFEQAMGVVLPTSLLEFLRLYQVDDFSMANVQFGQGGKLIYTMCLPWIIQMSCIRGGKTRCGL